MERMAITDLKNNDRFKKNGGKCPQKWGEVSPKMGGSVLTKMAKNPLFIGKTGIFKMLNYLVI